MIGVWTLDYPPNRFIGSELMTHELAKALLSAGHDVVAATIGTTERWTYEGVHVSQDLTGCDLLLTHADMPGVGWKERITPQVVVCHNVEAGVALALHNTKFALVVCNSEAMRDHLAAREEQNYIVVRPPAPRPGRVSRGDRVTIVNVNDNKVGPFWSIALAMPDTRFLVVLGGYGDQILPKRIPGNVEVLEHVSRDQMWSQVWSRTRLLLAPSIRESWNMTAGEAVGFGIPVISTDLPGVRENLGHAGTYLKTRDVSTWVNAIRNASAPSVAVRRQAIANHDRHLSDLNQFVEAVTDIGNNYDQTAQHYHRRLRQHRPGPISDGGDGADVSRPADEGRTETVGPFSNRDELQPV